MRIDITANTQSLQRGLQKLVNRYSEANARKLVKAMAVRFWDRVSYETPVDTGRARANWQLDTEYNPGTIEGPFNNAPGAHLMPPALEDAMVYWVFNNLDYIGALEDGHSQQKPTGFIAQALAAFGAAFEAEARKLGYGKA